MAVRMNVALSDDLAEALERVSVRSETTRSEVFRKALQLFLAAHDGKAKGLKIGLVDPQTNTMITEFIGL